MNNRKIIQIATSITSHDGEYFEKLIALCDDGTVWESRSGGRWEQVHTNFADVCTVWPV